MALTRTKKEAVVADVAGLLATSKMTIIAKYQGTTVKALQQLRRQARDNGTTVRVAKNRLVRQALKQTDNLKGIETDALEGMLLYAFNASDEVAPAQVLASFAKANPSLEFTGAITADGRFLPADKVKELAALPGKGQLIAEVIAMLNSPANDVVNALSGNIHALLDGVAAKAA